MNDSLEILFTRSLSFSAQHHEWWWCTNEALLEIGNILKRETFVYLDHFLPDNEANQVAIEIANAYREGRLSEEGIVGGGRQGKSTAYNDKSIRGDMLGYFDGTESEGWACDSVLPRVMAKMNTIVCELRDSTRGKGTTKPELNVPELSNVTTRSRAMITCYPGNGALYSRHIDNAIGNGRKLTCILYLNPAWEEGDGGELKLYHPRSCSASPMADAGQMREESTTIAPVLNRVLLFWSDARAPHEVLPCHKPRFAVTLWFIDAEERDRRAVLDAEEIKRMQASKRCDTSGGTTGDTSNRPGYEYDMHSPEHIVTEVPHIGELSIITGGMTHALVKIPPTVEGVQCRPAGKLQPEVSKTLAGDGREVCLISFPPGTVDELFVRTVTIDVSNTCVRVSFVDSVFESLCLEPTLGGALSADRTRAKFNRKRGTLTIDICSV